MKKVLFLDPGSNSIGFSVAEIRGDKFVITNSGALSITASWELGRRLNYMYKSLKFLTQHFGINLIVSEEAIIARGMAGAAVVPTIVNNLKMMVYDMDSVFSLELMHIDQWRKLLPIVGIPLAVKGKVVLNKRGTPKKDFKIPCAIKVKELLKLDLPAEILDNKSLKMKAMPSDVTDSLGIAVAWAKKEGFKSITAEKDLFLGAETTKVVKILYTLIKK